VAGGILIAIAIAVVLPVLLIVSGAAYAVLLGVVLRRNGEATHEGSELVDLNR
jgi:hypothetical protein